MASAAAALKQALVVAVCCVVLLHSSVGQQPPPPPASPHCPYTGQQTPPPPAPVVPAPAPTPVPAPMPPAPAPAPVNNCTYSDCASQCSPSCQANSTAGLANCDSLLVGAFNGCYDSCTNHTCPGKSCVHSGCGFGNCSCDNPHASSCCVSCRNAVSPTLGSPYQQCRNYWERYVGYCIMSCQDRCSKNCTQGA